MATRDEAIRINVEVVGLASIAELEARLKTIRKQLSVPAGTTAERKALVDETRFIKENLFELNQEQKNLKKNTKETGSQLSKFQKTSKGTRKGIQGMSESMRVFARGSKVGRLAVSALEDTLISGANVWAAVATVTVAAAVGLFKYLTRATAAEKAQKQLNKSIEDSLNSTQAQISLVENLGRTISNETLSLDTRNNAIEEFNKIVPESLRLQELGIENTITSIETLNVFIKALKDQAEVQGILNNIIENENKLRDIENKQLSEFSNLAEETGATLGSLLGAHTRDDLLRQARINNRRDETEGIIDNIIADKLLLDSLIEGRQESLNRIKTTEKETKAIKEKTEALKQEENQFIIDEGIPDLVAEAEESAKAAEALIRFRQDIREREIQDVIDSFEKLTELNKFNIKTEIELEEQKDVAIQALKDKFREEDQQKTKDALDKQIQLEFQASQARMKIRADLLGGFSKLIASFNDDQGKKSKAAFEVSKALAAAEATVSTIAGAQNVFKTTAEILPQPFPTIAAAGALAAGFANVKKILSTKLGGSATGITSTGLNATNLQPQATGFTSLAPQQVDVRIPEPIKAFVVESELRDVSERVTETIDVSTIV